MNPIYIFLLVRFFRVTLPGRFLFFCPLYSSFLSIPSFPLHSHSSCSLRLWFLQLRIGPALSTTGSPVTSSLSSTEAGVFFFPGAASRELDKRTSRPESRWRDRREGQISDGIAAEKRHLMLDCLSSLSLFLVTFTSSKPGSIVATSRRDKMNPIVSPGGIIMNAHSPGDTKWAPASCPAALSTILLILCSPFVFLQRRLLGSTCYILSFFRPSHPC